MSWRAGAKLFADVWPHVRAQVPRVAQRQEFTSQLVALFLEWDVDPNDIADVHPEVRRALAALGSPVDEEPAGDDDVAGCVRQLASPAEKDRLTAAEAIEFFVHQADDSEAAAAVALLALACALRDASVRVRRAAAKSLDLLLSDGYTLSAAARKKLTAASGDDDALVRKWVEKALARAKR